MPRSVGKCTAIFVIKTMHKAVLMRIDAHRTTGYTSSARGSKSIALTIIFATLDGMLKTIELLLGIGPLSQYDAVADPIMDWKDTPSNSEPYEGRRYAGSRCLQKSIRAAVKTNCREMPRIKMVSKIREDGFHARRRAAAAELDEITWKTVKGPTAVMPVMHRTLPEMQGDDDDDSLESASPVASGMRVAPGGPDQHGATALCIRAVQAAPAVRR